MQLYGKTFGSRLLLGTALYPSPAVMAAAVRASGAEVLTVSLRRENAAERTGQDFWSLIRDTGATVLPNTAGCHSVKEAVTTAEMGRELFDTPLGQARSDRRGRYASNRTRSVSSRRLASSVPTALRCFPTQPTTSWSPNASSKRVAAF